MVFLGNTHILYYIDLYVFTIDKRQRAAGVFSFHTRDRRNNWKARARVAPNSCWKGEGEEDEEVTTV